MMSCVRNIGLAALVATASLVIGCESESSSEVVDGAAPPSIGSAEAAQRSTLVFSFGVADDQSRDSLKLLGRVTTLFGGILSPVVLDDEANAVILVGEGGQARLLPSDGAGDYSTVFTAPVRAEHWKYDVDVILKNERFTAATIDLRSRPGNVEVLYSEERSEFDIAWEWLDDGGIAPTWTPGNFYGNFTLKRCVFDDGETVDGRILDSDAFASGIFKNVWRGEGDYRATVPLFSILTIVPDRAMGGTCDIDVSVAISWLEDKEDTEPALIVIGPEFGNESLSEDRRPVLNAVIGSDSRTVSVRVPPRP